MIDNLFKPKMINQLNEAGRREKIYMAYIMRLHHDYFPFFLLPATSSNPPHIPKKYFDGRIGWDGCRFTSVPWNPKLFGIILVAPRALHKYHAVSKNPFKQPEG